MRNEAWLRECWRDSKQDAASGVDAGSAQADEPHLEANIRPLVERLTRKRYRATRVRRHSSPKGEGQLRPLGRPAVEDTRLPWAVTRLLPAIDEPDVLRGKSGYLTLTRLVVDSYEREEYLLFSGFDETGSSLDQETMEKLFGCAGRTDGSDPLPAAVTQRHAKATVSRSLEQNSVHFNQAREKLEKWADDMVLSAEWGLQDTKEQIKALRRQARQATTLEEQHEIQEKIQKLERQQRRQRQDIFKAEDEIMEKRDALIESLERRLAKRTASAKSS